MIHSRPGYHPRVTHEGKKAPPPAKLAADMQPAFIKHSTATAAVNSPLKNNADPAPLSAERMQAAAEAALKRMNDRKAAEDATKTQVLVNPKPSPTPVMTTPYKD